ncbi:cytochrome o ubiquinol oxidase subunit 3 [Palleronia salina]|uniref:Cytochrome bo(3) ubiquinol oxidase subunit 3 n=1 Tax=Palleronia salina TaxID=313368 RepID=A0A1M6BQI1_9RHOB|nr:cytochrome c oxidase subunit 3 [Palleronia salina]SHI50823.1 cytochrome o ubiquinol oxidase subunit 3 [Palleronia salina]
MSQARHPGLKLGHEHDPGSGEVEALVFGFWIFMMSDLLIFGCVFATYVVMLPQVADGPSAAELFHLRGPLIETTLLLASSVTIGFALLETKHRADKRRTTLWLAVTFLLGAGFLFSSTHSLLGHLENGAGPSRSAFLSAYWLLVPLHALHVAIGCLWIAVAAAQVRIRGFDWVTTGGLLRLSIYWHFLDIVWIGILSVVYLGAMI